MDFYGIGYEIDVAVTLPDQFRFQGSDGIEILVDQGDIDADGGQALVQEEAPFQRNLVAFGCFGTFDIATARNRLASLPAGGKECGGTEGEC